MANFNPMNIEKALQGIDFPTDKEAVLDKARENGAGEEEITALEKLPEREYSNPTQITEALRSAEGDSSMDDEM